jgi:hypothetical protein
MNTEEIKLVLSYVGAFGVGGIIAGGFVFLLLKSFIPSYLREKGKNLATREDIARITEEIECVKSQYAVLLLRQSRIYERQAEILANLYKSLHEVHNYSVLMTQAVSIVGAAPYEASELFKSALKDAHNEFAIGRLYLPAGVTKLVDAFFQKIDERHLQILLAQSDSTNDQTRDQYWDNAWKISSKEIPPLLQAIEKEARIIIYE